MTQRFGLHANVTLIGSKEFSRNLHNSPSLMLSVLNQILREIGNVFVPALKAETPVKTGKLRDSTVYEIKGSAADMRLEVRQNARTANGTFYGHMVRMGTRPHPIVPRNAKALAFMIGGNLVFAKRVNHPGTRANKYHVRAWNNISSAVEAIMQNAAVRITTSLANVKKVI